MEQINERQRIFVQKHVKEMKPASVAYRETYGATGNSAEVSASQLLRNPKVVKEIEEVRKDIQKDVEWAYQNLKAMASDPMTPAAERRKIFDSILSRSNLDPAQKVESKNETVLPGITDLSKNDLIKMLQNDTL